MVQRSSSVPKPKVMFSPSDGVVGSLLIMAWKQGDINSG